MRGIRTTLQLVDQMTAPVMAIRHAISGLEQRFHSLGNAANLDVSSLTAMRNQVALSDAAVSVLNDNMQLIADSVDVNTAAQTRFNAGLSGGNALAGNLLGTVTRLAAAAGVGFGVKQITGLSDTMSDTRARLGLIVDDGGSVKALEDKIFASAQRSGAMYANVAQGVAKLGLTARKAFGNTDEIIRFTELMNKNFRVAGASAQEQAATVYQLTQAMASGRLQGDEYKSVVENAPILAQSIENYMRNVLGATGTMKDWSSEGLLTADVIKAATFASADEIEERWADILPTWAQNWSRMLNIGLYALTPLLEKINALANDPRVLVAMDAMGAGLNALAGVGIWTIDVFVAGAEWIVDNWSVIGPVVFGLAVAFGVLGAATLAYAAAQGVANLALLKSPLTWVALAIGVLTVVFYKLVAAVNKFAGTSYSATGLIMGYFFTLGAFVHNNFFLPLWNAVADIVNFFANAWKDPMGAVKIMFMQLALDVIGYARNMARAIESLLNAIPGVKVSMTSALDGIYNDISDSIANQKAGMGWEDVIKRREQIDYTAAFAGGYDFGKGIVDKFSDMSGFEFPESGAGDWSDIAANTALIAANTSKQADFGEEELKLWRDIAERDAINRFTTAEVSVAFGDVNNNVSSDMDLDGIAEYIGNSIEETLEIVAMGVYE